MLTLVGDDALPDLRPLHWGMCLTTHPFFRDVAAVSGRLLSLQGSVALAMITGPPERRPGPARESPVPGGREPHPSSSSSPASGT